MTKIILKNISKEYKKGVPAVDSVSFEINDGEFCALVGPSGCGKSTILRMIAGLETITSGELYFDDKLMNEIAPQKRDIGMVFQNYALYPHLTVFENIAFPLSIRKENKDEIKKKVHQIADLLNLSEYLTRKPKELSGGQRQRVAVGRAIVRKPKVFLFDEPLSNLDAKLRTEMRTEIAKLQRELNITTVYVTHDQIEAMTMGNRIAALESGKLQQIGSPQDLYNNPQNLFTAAFIGSPQMNLFEGAINNGTFVSDEYSFPISHIQNIDITTLGIRPENLSLTSKSDDMNSIEITIENIEYLGNETIIYFRAKERLLCIRAHANVQNKIGEQVNLYYSLKDVYLFDKDGKRS